MKYSEGYANAQNILNECEKSNTFLQWEEVSYY